VTGELEKLSIRDKYHGGDQVHTTSGTSMRIDHVGHNTLHSPIRKI
jgi:preprotein translocase subunit YajC